MWLGQRHYPSVGTRVAHAIHAAPYAKGLRNHRTIAQHKPTAPRRTLQNLQKGWNSPRLPAEKRLEQADPDRASFPLTQPSPPYAKFSDATPPPPLEELQTDAVEGPACRWLLQGEPPPPHPPHPLKTLFLLSCPGAGPGCRGGARKRLQLEKKRKDTNASFFHLFALVSSSLRLLPLSSAASVGCPKTSSPNSSLQVPLSGFPSCRSSCGHSAGSRKPCGSRKESCSLGGAKRSGPPPLPAPQPPSRRCSTTCAASLRGLRSTAARPLKSKKNMGPALPVYSIP